MAATFTEWSLIDGESNARRIFSGGVQTSSDLRDTVERKRVVKGTFDHDDIDEIDDTSATVTAYTGTILRTFTPIASTSGTYRCISDRIALNDDGEDWVIQTQTWESFTQTT